MQTIRRRDFLWMTGAAAGALAGFDSLAGRLRGGGEIPPESMPGVESQAMTTCLMCPGGCGIRVRRLDGYPVSISGNPNHPLNAGGICTEGMAALQQLYHPDRLLRPMRRRQGRRTNDFEPVSWEEALGAIAGAMKDLRANPEALGFVQGRAGGTMEALVAHLMSQWGSPHIFLDQPRDDYPVVFEAMHGLRARPAFDFDGSDYVLSFGADLLSAWESPLQFQRSYASFHNPARSSKGRLVVADIRYSRTAAQAGEFVGLMPGSFGALALGMAYVILREKLYDAQFVEDHLHGFYDIESDARRIPGYRTVVLRDYSPEVVSRLTGIEVDKILSLGKAFGESAAPLAIFDENVTAQPGGMYAAMAIHSLNLLKGNVNRPGGIYLQPHVPLSPLSPSGAGRSRQSKELVIEDLLRLDSNGKAPQILFLYYSNPAYSSAFGRQIAAILEKVPLVISFSPFKDETSRYVDYLLPDALPLERWEDRLFPPSFPMPGWGMVQPCLPPAGETRHSGDVVIDLAHRLGAPMAEALPWKNFEELLKYRARGLHAARSGALCVDPFHLGLVGEMERRGWWMTGDETFDQFWQRLLDAGVWADPNFQVRGLRDYSGHSDGKIDLFSRVIQRQRTQGGTAPADIEFLPHFHSGDEPRMTLEYPMTLNPYRPGKFGGGSHGVLPWILQGIGLVEDVAWRSWAEINPEDAEELKIRHLEWIWVESATGKLKVRAVVHPGTGPRVVNIPCGFGHTEMGRWGQARGVNPLRLLVPERDAHTGLPYRFATKVKIYRA